MPVFYNLGIRFYGLGVRIASISNPKAKKWVAGRKGIFEQLKKVSCDNLAWFHCASLGEYEQGKPVMEELKNLHPEIKLLVTFFSPSGFEVRKNDPLIDYVFYLPLDTPKNARKFIDLIKPKVAVFVKYEFWLNYILQLQKKAIPTYFISAIFRPNHHLFKLSGKAQLAALQNVNHIFVQEEFSMKILLAAGFKNVTVSGDTRLDRVYNTAQTAEALSIIEKFKGNSKILIAGSSWPEEEKLLAPYINNTSSELKFIIAPHDISENHVRQIIEQIKVPVLRYSQAKSGDTVPYKVLLIDNIGLLARLYRYGDLALVGGGFSGSLHNILEPAAFGMPIMFGPQHSKFPEAQQLITNGGAVVVTNAAELKKQIEFFLNDETIWRMASEMSKHFVHSNRGATGKIVKSLTKHFN